ncbi:MAG TPA: dihydrolipoyl dehydrogenase, partial [Usitatibacter sp.]|nr:dihydrolipoyl dehydrogenase [Usitatibacter sp.]
MAQAFDVVVIGAGPGGYIAAVRAAQLGFKTACIEGWKNARGELALGGTCLNVGCIPSKALLASSEEYEKVSHHLEPHGITVSGAKMDVAKMQSRKDAIVSKMTKGVEFLFKKNKITWLQGFGRFVKGGDTYTIAVGDEEIQAKHVIVATGSKARHLPGVPVDNETICDNEGALAFGGVPKRLGVIGAGVIGLEMGSVWRRLGSEVTILEALPAFLGACDDAIAKEAAKQFKAQGLSVSLGVKIGKVTAKKGSVTVEYTDALGAAQKLECEKLIVSIGRVPNTDGLGADKVALKVDARGFIEVDDHCRTNLPNVYAIGDVVRGPMLAHKAEDEGVMAAELIAGQKPHIDYDCIPWIIYTSPEIAWVGKSEQQAKAAGIEVKTGQFPFSINGRALGTGDSIGFAKVVADAKTDRVLGVHII